MRTAAVITLWFIKSVSFLSRAFFWIAVALLVAAVLIVGQMVVIRYIFVGSTVWQTEFVIYAATAAVFLSTPQVLQARGHVRIGLLSEHVSPQWRRIWDTVADVFSAIFLFLLAGVSWIYFEEAWRGGWVTETAWELPLWIPLLSLFIGISLAALQCFAEILRIAIGDDVA